MDNNKRNSVLSVSKENRDRLEALKKKPIYHKLRAKVIEQLAINMIAERMDENGEGIPIPASWITETNRLMEELLEAVSDEEKCERELEDEIAYGK